MDDEPLPVINIQYRAAKEHGPWWNVVTLLAILLLIGSAANVYADGFGVTYFFDHSYRAGEVRLGYSAGWLNFSGASRILAAVVDLVMVVGAAGCLRSSDRFRSLTVMSCWANIAVRAINVIASIGLHASRAGGASPLGAPLLEADAFGRQLTTNVMLALAVAILFARPEIRRLFVGRDEPLTP